MASLNTLRTKYGVILSVVIILALLAFIISLGPEMGFFGSNDPTVGVINGEKVGYLGKIAYPVQEAEDMRNSGYIMELNMELLEQYSEGLVALSNRLLFIVRVFAFAKCDLYLDERALKI